MTVNDVAKSSDGAEVCIVLAMTSQEWAALRRFSHQDTRKAEFAIRQAIQDYIDPTED